MSKPRISLVLLACTMFLTLWMHARKPTEEPVEARIVPVRREDVHQVVAITGRLTYADESYAYAREAGRVSKVCVQPGQRVAGGEALVRLDGAEQQDVISAFVSNSSEDMKVEARDDISERISMENTVIRSLNACTVRQILVQENSLVAAGMPVARLSSNQQEIVCSVCRTDAESLEAGMWAWISADDEEMGHAEVASIGEVETDAESGMTFSAVTLRPEQHIDLPEGAVVDAEVYLAGSDDVLSLPVEAITERNTVWWVDQGRCTEIPAQIVLCDEMHAWVNLPEGLLAAVGEFEEGQRVVEASE